MKALLLLAGRSQRFWPLADKALFPLCGKTLLSRQVENLKAGGITDITFVGGKHNVDLVRSLFPEIPCIEQEDLTLGMRGALLSALPALGEEPVLVVSSNDFVDSSAYRSLLAEAVAPGVGGAILAVRVQEYFPGGYLTFDGKRICSIVEKPGAGNEPSSLVNIVAHVHNSSSLVLKTLKKLAPRGDDGYEQGLDALFKEQTYHAVPYEGPWHPVKYPWHILSLLERFLSEITKTTIHPSAVVHPTAVIDGPVHIEEGVRVLPHATIKGPCFVGKRSVIATGALVRGASIGEDCVIGFNTEVKSSAVSSHVWTHMTYLGDSIIGRNVSFGGGSITGNFRLDEGIISSDAQGQHLPTGLKKFGAVIGDNCRLGIHTSMNPGVKIGEGSFISSDVLVSKDIPKKSFVTMKNGEMDIRPNRTEAPQPEARAAYRTAWKASS